MKLTRSVLCLTLVLSACSTTAPEPPVEEATVFFNGRILTMDGDEPVYAESVVSRAGRIAFVGSLADASLLFAGAPRRDLEGKTLLPGFLDPHGHFMFALKMENQVNLANPPVGPCVDIPSTIAALEAQRDAAQVPAGGWIIGWGYDADGLAEGRQITKLDLDPHFPDHKLALIHVSGHGAVLNSKALEWAGVSSATETPQGGIINRLPGSNEPAGLLMETAYLPVFAKLPRPSEAELLELMRPAQLRYARQGYTHAHEGFTHIEEIAFLREAAARGLIFLDIACLPNFAEAGEWMQDPSYVFGEYENGLKLQGIKFTQDGSPQGRTAYVTEPYLTGGPGGEADWRGEPTQPREQFIEQVKGAFDAGLQVFIHANGDAAIDQVIEAVDAAGITAADDRRTVVIHSQFQRPDQLDEYVRLGLTPSYFTNHCFFWGDVHIRNIGRQQADFISPIEAARAKGLVVSNHTDFNITPLDPFFVMWTAMARETRSGVVLGPDQRVTAYTALQGLTTGPAYQIFEEHRKGRLRAGLQADFVILSADPLEVGVHGIRELEVLETIKAGETIYRRQ